jgi:ubiquinone/menaquinone biosynthesis C-methylase UbiE
MAHKTKKNALTPKPILEDLMASWRTQTLVAGIRLDVFTHIVGGKRTAKEVADAADASLRGMTYLLDALVGIGYLRKNGGRYSVQPLAAAFLVRGKQAYMGSAAHVATLNWEAWNYLTEAVKTGHPYRAINVAEAGKEFFPKLVSAIFPNSFAASRAAVSSLAEKDRKQIKKILDVAAGSGAWSLAFAQALPEARVTAVDFPEVTPITRQFAEKFGAAARYDFLEGDMQTLDFGRKLYDLAILGHIIHSEGERQGRELIRKCCEALRPGGLLLIAEYIPNDSRTEPAIPLMFGLNMLLHTEEGNVFTMREYRAWLKEAGFRTVTTITAPAPSPLILARK